MNAKRQILVGVGIVLVTVVLVAFRLGRDVDPQSQGAMEGHNHAAMTAGGDEQSPVRLDEEGARRIGVTYATVERKYLTQFVQTVGIVGYDETRLATVNPKVMGWVEKLYVDFTGAPVQAGQPLMDVYSPALVSAQEELVLAARLVSEAGGGRASDNATELLSSARRRLAYWDIPDEDIERIEKSGEPTKTLTLRAPASGIVVEKNVIEGDRIMPGMTVYRIADLSRVWVDAEIFEKDLGLVREGQGALVSFEAFPGKTFPGQVTFIHPTVSVQTRTARLRIELPNPDETLRPGMYAQIRVDANQGEGFPLVVPRSAVVATGQRVLVFVRSADGTLVPREVRMGRTSGPWQEILSGLDEGETVVSSAAFLVDAESNLGQMTMPGMDMGAPGAGGDMEGMGDMPGMDHSGHDMGAMTPAADTSGASGHQGHGG